MLFQIQDESFPMYVIATSWAQAVDKWRNGIAKRAGHDGAGENAEAFNPDAVIFLAQDDEVIL